MAKPKKHVSVGLHPDLHDRMVTLVDDSSAYRYKTEFIRDAIRERVERLEQREVAEVPPPGDTDE